MKKNQAHSLLLSAARSRVFQRKALAVSFTLAAATALTACLTPPPRSEADMAKETPASGTSVAEKVKALGIEPVVPEDSLVWDGANISLINIEPAGSWYAFNDATPGGEMVPPTVSEFEQYLIDGKIHTEGKGFREWGGGIGMNFVGSPMLTPIDASRFKGVRFKASGEGWVHVGLGTIATMPEFEICGTCYDHFAKDIKLTSEEVEYKYTWDELKQAGWGSPSTTLDPATIVAFTFTSRGASAWNFNIDDVGFIE